MANVCRPVRKKYPSAEANDQDDVGRDVEDVGATACAATSCRAVAQDAVRVGVYAVGSRRLLSQVVVANGLVSGVRVAGHSGFWLAASCGARLPSRSEAA